MEAAENAVMFKLDVVLGSKSRIADIPSTLN